MSAYRQNAQPCDSCRYWSEMLAEVRAGTIRAICLHPERTREWRPAWPGCDQWRDAPLGAIDSPDGGMYQEGDDGAES